jgi:hypothetical protein
LIRWVYACTHGKCPPLYYVDSIRDKWLGWKVVWLKQQYEKQLDFTQEKLTFPVLDRQKYWKQLADLLLIGSSDPRDRFLTVLEKIQEEAEEVYVLPQALIHHTLEMSLDQKREIFTYACQQVMKKDPA